MDYLEPQPTLPHEPDVFLLRHVLHNLSDKYAGVLLKNLRKAAHPKTTLLAIDYIIQYTCPLPEGSPYDHLGYKPPAAPAPLLPNFGVAASMPYGLDLQVRWFHWLVIGVTSR